MSSPVSNISIRLWHPTLPAIDIISELALQVKFSNSVGQKKKTPKGEQLEGIYQETYCCFLFRTKTTEHLHKEFAAGCEHLEARASFMDNFLRTGGRLEFYVSIFLDGDRGFELDNLLLRRMDALGLGLSVELYRLRDEEL
jgi:hypothetical protein